MDALVSEGLPPGWQWARLDEVCDICDYEREPVKREDREARCAGRLERDLIPYFGATGQAGWIDTARSSGPAILLGEDGAPFLDPGKAKAYRVSGRYWVNNHAHILRPRDPRLEGTILHQLNILDYTQFVSGTTRLKLTSEAMRRIPIAVPPIAEAARLADAIDALFEEVEAGEAALARAREGLTQFRASLLHAACTGALTADWRAANPTNETGDDLLAAVLRRRKRVWEHGERARGRRPSAYPQPPEPAASDLPPLPAGWAWSTVAQLSFVSGGLTKNASRNDSPTQLPYLRVGNVGEDRIDLSDLRTIGVTKGELPRIALLPGDLLFVEGNGSADQIGRVALWRGQVRPCVHQNHLIKARPVRRFLGRWMRDWFMSPLGKQFVQAAASSTSGLHTLSISKIEGLPVPIPPAIELRRILPRSAEMKREHADGALVLDQQSDALSPLRQSILHAAFTGRLVPQDPADEPAATLLARLRAVPTATRRPRQREAAAQPDLIETPA